MDGGTHDCNASPKTARFTRKFSYNLIRQQTGTSVDPLLDTHRAINHILGAGAEPLDILRAVERHRHFWRPASPRVVLLAESHVFTTRGELQRSLRPFPELPADLPRQFVRLVYALGYGEDQLLDQAVASPRNSGTPQYWKIFQSCLTSVGSAPNCAAIQVSRTPDARTRLRAKLHTLTQLKDRGIWLVDASVATLYLPGQSKPVPRVREQVLHISWDGCIAGVIAAAAPDAILCVGVGVARALRTRLDRLNIPWAGVHQPQAHLSSQEHADIHGIYSAVCADPTRIGSVPSVHNER